jgi:hypothetical protein
MARGKEKDALEGDQAVVKQLKLQTKQAFDNRYSKMFERKRASTEEYPQLPALGLEIQEGRLPELESEPRILDQSQSPLFGKFCAELRVFIYQEALCGSASLHIMFNWISVEKMTAQERHTWYLINKGEARPPSLVLRNPHLGFAPYIQPIVTLHVDLTLCQG